MLDFIVALSLVVSVVVLAWAIIDIFRRKSKMRVAYIAGPYRADTIEGIEANIAAARKVSLKYWKLGYAVICPHLNTAMFDGECDDSVWLTGDIEIMLRCDVVVMMETWKQSGGATNEHARALNHGIEIIYDQATYPLTEAPYA